MIKMGKQEEKIMIDCKDWDCFVNGNTGKCLDCKKGTASILCFNCGQTHIIKSTFMRIDCECGAGIIPCYNTCEFINRELIP